MRYILNDDGYIDEISFDNNIECKNKTCTEYTGTIPAGYTSLKEWADGEAGKLNAWKILDGNLVFDENKYNELEEIWEKEAVDNSFVYHKELYGMQQQIEDIQDVSESQFKKETAEGEIIEIDNVKKTYPKVKIKNINCYDYNKVKVMSSGKNMLPNDALSQTISGITFTANNDRSIKISGTATSDIEYNLAGTSTNTSSFLCFKKNRTYYLYVADFTIKMYKYDGTNREQIYAGSSGKINFTDEAKEVTQIVLSIPSGTEINDTLYPMLSINPITQEISSITIDGRSTQETRSGKNMFDKSSTPSYTSSSGINITELNSGVRISCTESSSSNTLMRAVYKSIDLTNYVGKEVRIKSDFSKSNENLAPTYNLGLCDVNGNNTIDGLCLKSETSGEIVSFTIPTLNDTSKYLCVWLYATYNTPINEGDYVDFTNLIIAIDNEDMTYEPYGVMPSPDYPSEVECIKGINLLKGLSTPRTDTNYWNSLSSVFTPLSDGWGKWEYDNTSGTSTSFMNAMVNLSAIDLKPSTTYTFVVEIRNSTISENSNAYLQIITNNATGAFKTGRLIGYQDINENKKIVFNSVTKDSFNGVTRGVDTYLRLGAGTKGTVEARISLFEYGNNTSSTYVPYNSIQSKIVGKNLQNTNFRNGIYNANTGEYSANSNFLANTDIVSVSQNTSYIFSDDLGYSFEAYLYDKNQQFIGRAFATNNKFTTSEETYYINWRTLTSGQNSLNCKVQLEKGTTATLYEQYKENIINIDLQGNELCSLPNGTKDELVIENGRGKIFKKIGKVVFDGSESWFFSRSGTYYVFGLVYTGVKKGSTLYSNYFLDKTLVSNLTNDIGIANHNSVDRIYISNGSTTVADFKTWLSEHNTTVYYELETPEEIDLGATEQPKTFEGINNISNSENADMDIVKKVEYEEYKGSTLDIDFSSIDVVYPNGTTVNYILIEKGKIYINVDGNESEIGKGNVELYDGYDVIYGTKDTTLEVTYCIDNLDYMRGKSTSSNKFKVLEDGSIEAHNGYFSGKITATSGTIGGYDIGETKLSTNIKWDLPFPLDTAEQFQNVSSKIINYANGTGTLTEDELILYDVNNDGVVDKLDANMLARIYYGYLDIEGTFEINSGDYQDTLSFKDTNGNTKVGIGLNGINTEYLSVSGVLSSTGDAQVNDLTVTGTFTNNSDERLKKDIKELSDNYIDIIKKATPVEFTYKNNDTRHIGFIAQKLEKIFENAKIDKIPIKRDKTNIYSIDYISLIGVLWKGTQDLYKKIEELENKIKELEKM